MKPDGKFAIHRLFANDIELLRNLIAMFSKAFDEVDAYLGAPPSAEYLEKLLGGDQFIALAAMQGGVVIGGLAAYELKKFERERSEVYIYDLAVDEAHRRKGVATDLILALKPIAAACGAYVIFVQADHGDDPAIALYTKLGRREDVLHFDIAID